MPQTSSRALILLALAAVLAGSVMAAAEAPPTAALAAGAPAPGRVASRAAAPAPAVAADPLRGLDPLRHHLEGERLVAELPAGRRADLSLDPTLQAHLEKLLASYQVPYGAVVALDPESGRVLAYVSHSSANPAAGDLVRDATPPAASVFKIVTAAALLDSGVSAASRVCYSGGMSRLELHDLNDNAAHDKSCASLSDAMGGSINSVFAKLADRHLSAATLGRYAQAFGFGHALPFDVPSRPSPSEVPVDRLEFARTAAGFWHMHMSPLHGALLAATVANGGTMPRPSLADRVLGADGQLLFERKPQAFRSVIGRDTAQALATMMERTVSHGTARSAFFDPKGKPFLPGFKVSGKTGSLSTERPYRAYSWWVGFASGQGKRLAVSALVVNDPLWRIKASFVAREALREYLMRAPALVAAPAIATPASATPAAPLAVATTTE